MGRDPISVGIAPETRNSQLSRNTCHCRFVKCSTPHQASLTNPTRTMHTDNPFQRKLHRQNSHPAHLPVSWFSSTFNDVSCASCPTSDGIRPAKQKARPTCANVFPTWQTVNEHACVHVIVCVRTCAVCVHYVLWARVYARVATRACMIVCGAQEGSHR